MANKHFKAGESRSREVINMYTCVYNIKQNIDQAVPALEKKEDYNVIDIRCVFILNRA